MDTKPYSNPDMYADQDHAICVIDLPKITMSVADRDPQPDLSDPDLNPDPVIFKL
jgi:hypothetical protein